MKLDLSQLKKPVRHPLHTFFKQFSISQISKEIGCSPGYLRNVLGGHVRPSPELDLKITALAEKIRTQSAEQVQLPSTHSKELR